MKMLALLSHLGKVANIISGSSLTCIMLLTVADVILRYMGQPILGSYELVSLGAAVFVGFALPHTSMANANIKVDTLLAKLSGWRKGVMAWSTRIMSMGLFVIIGLYLAKKGLSMYRSGEMSPTLQIPFYPVAYCLALCCFMQAVVLVGDIVKAVRGEYE